MIYDTIFTNLRDVRQQHPSAAIIRPMGQGRFVVFDRAEDAIGHPTTTATIRNQEAFWAPMKAVKVTLP